MFNVYPLNYKRSLFWLIIVSALIKIAIASIQGLGNVEAYYWTLATKLQWNYFDHPPMVAWLIRLTTANLLLHNELFVRLGAILSSSVCIWLMFKIGALLHSERAGWFAALLYATSIYSGINIAAFILPDSPQMVFWLSALYILLKIIRVPTNDAKYVLYWCLFGTLSGLCIMSKVHGVFLWVGVLLYFLIYDNKRFNSPYVYLAFGITLFIISPIFIWNLQHDFITYKFHASRVSIAGSGLDWKRFTKQLFQVIFATGPIHVFLIGMGIYLGIKNKLGMDKKSGQLILLCTLPLILIVLAISVTSEILPHWPGPALSTLFILPAIYMAGKPQNTFGKIPIVLRFAIAITLIIVTLQVLVTNYFPGALSAEKQDAKMGTGDVTLDMYGWQEAATKFDSLYKSDLAKKIMPARAPLIITHWIPGAQIDYYIAHQTGQEVFGLGGIYDLHQFFLMNSDKTQLVKGDSAYYIVPSNLFTYKTLNKVTDSFKEYDYALIFSQNRSGFVCKKYYIIRLKGYKGIAF